MTSVLQRFLNIANVSSTPYNIDSNTLNFTIFYVDLSSLTKKINLPVISSITKGVVLFSYRL